MVKKQMVVFLEANQLQFMLAIAHFAQHENNHGFALATIVYCLWCQNWYFMHFGKLYKGRDFRHFLFIFHYQILIDSY